MKQQPLVSIVIPVYNVEAYLSQCMESVLNQTYEKLDIVLADDGSTDTSPGRCDAYASLDERVQVIHKENGGPMSAVIAGVRQAKGEYLVFMDSDDWIEGNMIEALVGELSGEEGEIICSNYIIEKADKALYRKQSMRPGVYNRASIEAELLPYLLGQEERRIHGSRCMKLISGELIRRNLSYSDIRVSMGEDLYLMFLALLDAKRIVVMEEGYFYHYRYVETSLVHRYKPKLYREVSILYGSMRQVIETKVQDTKWKERFLQELQKEYIFLCFYVLKNELRGPGKGCAFRIKQYIRTEKQEKNLEDVAVEVQGKANRLLYMIWKHPGTLQIALGRMAIGIFDKLQG